MRTGVQVTLEVVEDDHQPAPPPVLKQLFEAPRQWPASVAEDALGLVVFPALSLIREALVHVGVVERAVQHHQAELAGVFHLLAQALDRAPG